MQLRYMRFPVTIFEYKRVPVQETTFAELEITLLRPKCLSCCNSGMWKCPNRTVLNLLPSASLRSWDKYPARLTSDGTSQSEHNMFEKKPASTFMCAKLEQSCRELFVPDYRVSDKCSMAADLIPPPCSDPNLKENRKTKATTAAMLSYCCHWAKEPQSAMQLQTQKLGPPTEAKCQRDHG